MSGRDWKHDYEHVVPRRKPPGTRRKTGAEKRRHPRLQPNGLSLWLGGTPGVELIDLSTDHIDFYANVPVDVGQRLHIQVDTAPPFAVEVVARQMEETDPRLLEVRYRVHGRILPAAKMS